MENNNVAVLDTDFDGVFRFSNNSDKDFTALWNNKEYTFPARTRSPIIIPNETPEHIQEIRKKWAYKWAEREWFESDAYKRLTKLDNFRGGRDDKDLEPLIQMCLDPLPTAKAAVKEGAKEDLKIKSSKPVDESTNLNETFKDEPIQKLGVMPNSPI